MSEADGRARQARAGARWAHWLKLLLGVAVAALFVWLLARGVDFQELSKTFGNLSPVAVGLALLLAGLAHLFRIARWWLLLQPGPVLGACVGPYLFSMAVNNVVPFRAGDAVRVLAFSRQLGVSTVRGAGTLMVERALDVIFVALTFFVLLLGVLDGVLPSAVVTGAIWLGGVAFAGLAALALLLPRLQGWALGWSNGPNAAEGQASAWRSRAARLARHLGELILAFRQMRSPRRAAMAVLLTAAVWICEGLAFLTVTAALDASLSPLAGWMAKATGALAIAIPSAPGYIGTFDYFTALGARAYGASVEVATALALTMHALWVPFTLLGLLCYWLPGPRAARKLAR